MKTNKILSLLAFIAPFVAAAFAIGDSPSIQIPAVSEIALQQEPDSTKLKFPVLKTGTKSIEDVKQQSPIDLKKPENQKTEIVYDPNLGSYVFRTFIGDTEVGTAFELTGSEYQTYTLDQSMRNYYRQKTAEQFSGEREEFGLSNMKFSLGPADKIFGPGGVRLKTTGSVEIILGVKNTNVKNPTLTERTRNRTNFNFDEKISFNVNAKVGDKVNFDMNYDTDATFDFDTKNIKLAYQGKEDEIIKTLEAGNVSMSSSGTLIKGTQALFGVKAGMQFGKLKATAILAQQESESKTVSSKGGVQLNPFEFSIEKYDENRHFFLSHFFRNNYDSWMSKVPYISSGITINRVEVWVTNKRGNYEQARNILAFMDLSESERIHNKHWIGNNGVINPDNASNSLYREITQEYAGIRNISTVTPTLEPLSAYEIVGGRDYDKIENARRLESSEYMLNAQLGYLSLNSMLQPDEVLAVAYEYTMAGKTYQVGEFSSDNNISSQTLVLKLLKSTGLSPDMPIWDLMMKNIYSLGAYDVQKEKFKLDITYLSDTTGVYLNYLTEGKIKNTNLLRVMNLDRLDSKNEPRSDGLFDFVNGLTIIADKGKIVFPVIEPFGSHLRKQIGNDGIADKYVFQELYDSTMTVAQQIAEKNKFRIKGEYKASSGSEIRLNATNIPRNSVKVTAGGAELKENVDYNVDYGMGVVTILNQSIIESGTPVSVSLENRSFASMQRKTLMGLDLSYAFSENFNVGGTIMHLYEKPLTKKVSMGDESISNTIWGLNTQYRTEFMWATNLLNKIPTVSATAPSTFSINAEFAHLIPGHPSSMEKRGVSYLDDFESSKQSYDLKSPYSWMIASAPESLPNPMYPNRSDEVKSYYTLNRAHLSWYYVDGLFTRKNSSLTPSHIKNDKDQLSNHYVREVLEQELFPNKQTSVGESSILPVLNLSYYPNERGMYNLDVAGMNADGYLSNPEQRWAGIMRKMDNTDFEAANIEYVEFWMLDPFIYDESNKGGELYLNLGEVSEDILKDGKKFFENGLPIDGDPTQVEETYWGKVPRRQSIVYAFDNTPGARSKQDVGLNGLSSMEELGFPTYKQYLESLQSKISAETRAKWESDSFSPLNDPAGDNYHYYRGSDYDRNEVDIISRYKRYNGVEGNSKESNESPESYDVSAKTVPDVEDINQDNTLNEYERYFQYQISIRKENLVVGNNFVTDKRSVKVKLRNGKEETVSWYQFKIPIKDYDKRVGTIRDFKTIRFLRMFMSEFEKPVTLRFGTLELVRGDWRQYTQQLTPNSSQPSTTGSLNLTSVNYEENGNKKPVNYVLPPGVSREIDPQQPQLKQNNEQSLAMIVKDLLPNDAKAIYKNTSIDMRPYKRIQMFVHGEQRLDDNSILRDGEITVFLRLGSDYKNNYYEYEVPLKLTPEGTYSNNSSTDREKVWPQKNYMDIPFELFTNLKMKRNREKRQSSGNVTFYTPFSVFDPSNNSNKATIVGNPNLGEVRTIMIGIRNNAREIKAVEVWVNELRLSDFNEEGGWAAQGNMNIALSDIATLNVGGRIETVGFGGIEQSVTERRIDDYYQYNIATNIELGRFLPEKAKVKAPLYYTFSEQVVTPKYDPYDNDLILKEVLDDETLTTTQRDSIKRNSLDVVTNKSFSMANVKVDIKSKVPMPYDPTNFSIGYSFNENSKYNPTTERELNKDYRGNFSYQYAPIVKPLTPFSFISKEKKSLESLRDISINYLPNSLSFTTNMQRNYYELKLKELTQTDGALPLEPSYSKDFLWDRDLNVRWDLTKQLKFTYRSATNARIEEPDGPVNRRFFPNEYEQWKDTVMQSIREFGTPLNYAQAVTASYDLPTNKIPILNWVTAGVKYNSTYNWDKGANIDETVEIGNVIRNQNQWNWDGRVNLESLYNKSTFLKSANDRFSGKRNNAQSTPKRKDMEREIALTGSPTPLKHFLNTKDLFVSAMDESGKPINVSFKVVDQNTVELTSEAQGKVKVKVTRKPSIEENPMYSFGQYVARGLMMVRNVSVSYRTTDGLVLPSFRPMIGGAFGQNSYNGTMAPGFDFAMGMNNNEAIDRFLERNWLISNDSLTTPASRTSAHEFRVTATIEPINGFRIELNANRLMNKNTQTQFMFDGAPRNLNGNFTMTHVAIATALRSSNAKNNYQSEVFDLFLKNRSIIAGRITNQYKGTRYPSGGFITDDFVNQPFDPSRGAVSDNSPDVLIPAFIAAYSGKDVSKIGLSPFPSITQLLPNWRITYDGLMQVPFFKKYLKNFNLSHAYRCTYGANSFNSYTTWIGAQDDLGYIKDVLTGNPIPSSPYDISSVTISESFAPLLGFDLTLKNNISGKIEYKDSRVLSLNMASVQIMENLSKEFTIGTGYKITDFKLFMKSGGKDSKFQSDLNLRADLSYRISEVLIRKIEDGFTQPTSGTSAWKINISADYALSKSITIRGFFDKQINTPLVSSSSYPVSDTSFGVSLRFSLNQ